MSKPLLISPNWKQNRREAENKGTKPVAKWIQVCWICWRHPPPLTTPRHCCCLGKRSKPCFSVEKLFISKQQCAKIFHLKEEGQACADKNVKLFHFYKTFQSRALTLVSSSKLAKPKIELLDSLSPAFSPPSCIVRAECLITFTFSLRSSNEAWPLGFQSGWKHCFPSLLYKVRSTSLIILRMVLVMLKMLMIQLSGVGQFTLFFGTELARESLYTRKLFLVPTNIRWTEIHLNYCESSVQPELTINLLTDQNRFSVDEHVNGSQPLIGGIIMMALTLLI